MESAIQLGKTVIVEQVRDKVSMNLQSIMKKSTHRDQSS